MAKVAEMAAAEPTSSPAPTGVEPRSRRARRGFGAAIVLIAVVAAVIRLVPVASGLPYATYVDEGHYLHPAAHMVANQTWQPGHFLHPYEHPPLLYEATAATAETFRLFGATGVMSGTRTTDRTTDYDVIEPSSLILGGRLVDVVFAVGTVVVTMLLGARLVGRRTAVVAGLLAAVTPALVSRSYIVIVDTPATFFVALTILLAAYADSKRRGLTCLVLAGAAAGLAFTSKYPSGAVFLVVAVAALMPRDLSLARRLGRVGWAALAALGAAVVSMPGLVFSTSQVLDDIRYEMNIYKGKTTPGGYWHQLISAREIGWVLFGLMLAGLVVLLVMPRSRRITVAWLVFAIPFVGWLLTQSYQPFRNVLPLVPFLVLAGATLIDRAVGAVAGRFAPHPLIRAGATGAIAVAVAALVFFTGSLPYIRNQANVVDSRVRTVDWLKEHVQPGQRVLIAKELAVLPTEMAKIPGRVTVASQLTEAHVDPTGYDYVVAARLEPTQESWTTIETAAGKPVVSRFGFYSGATRGFRGNYQNIRVFQNR